MLEQAIETLTQEIRKLREAVQAQSTLLAGPAHSTVPASTVQTPAAPAARVMQPEPEALDERAVSKLLGISVSLVRRWRVQKMGPPFRKFGRAVRYRRQDFMEWLDAVPQGGESR